MTLGPAPYKKPPTTVFCPLDGRTLAVGLAPKRGVLKPNVARVQCDHCETLWTLTPDVSTGEVAIER